MTDTEIIRKITPTNENTYEVLISNGTTDYQILCTVKSDGELRWVEANPPVLGSGQFGDPRPIVRAVVELHDQRHAQTEPQAHED